MKKIVLTLLIILLLMSIICTNYVFADDIEDIKSNMSDIGDASGITNTGTAKVINSVIGIMQIVGSGISLIVITMLGIKYILASPSEKADVKKNIMPILIGCVLLFAAVNIVGMIESFSNATLPAGQTTTP